MLLLLCFCDLFRRLKRLKRLKFNGLRCEGGGGIVEKKGETKADNMSVVGTMNEEELVLGFAELGWSWLENAVSEIR